MTPTSAPDIPPAKPLWRAAEAARATGGTATGDWSATGVSIDSRTVAAGDLFVALSGPSFDGHDFVAAALEAGAAAAVVARAPEGAPAERLLVVEDTMAALEALGRAARERAARVRLVAVTGSVGKTGSKEMLARALALLGPTHATLGNLNNAIGVPLTLARMPADSAYAVIEMGMNHAGEITPLSRLTKPDVALITAIAPAHIENLGSEEAIADAKAEIFDGLAPGGTAILPRDSRHFRRLRAAALAAGAGRVVGFGDHPDADARMVDVALDPGETRVFMTLDGAPLAYRLGTEGRHWALNSLATIAAVRAVGADPARVLAAFQTLKPPGGRGARTEVPMHGGPLHLIDESYNASPSAVAAAVSTLALAGTDGGGRRIAVLGDMLELGAHGPGLHADLAPVMMEHGIDLVFTAGPLMAHLDAGLPTRLRGGHAPTAAALAPLVTAAARPGDVIMVKGSAGMRMSTVVQALMALAEGDETAA